VLIDKQEQMEALKKANDINFSRSAGSLNSSAISKTNSESFENQLR
jgi:hypothetical protein